MQIRPDLIAPPLHPRPSATEAKTNPSPGARAAACAPCAWWAGERGGGAGRLILTIKRLNSPRLGPAGEPPGLFFCFFFFFCGASPTARLRAAPRGDPPRQPRSPAVGVGPPPKPGPKTPGAARVRSGELGQPLYNPRGNCSAPLSTGGGLFASSGRPTEPRRPPPQHPPAWSWSR